MQAAGPVAVGAWTAQAIPWAALEAFVAAHALPRLPAEPRWILNELVAAPGKVVTAAAAGRLQAVAVVVDAGQSDSGAAELLLLAALPGQPDPPAAVALAAAAAELTAAPALELALVPRLAAAEPALRAQGFAPAYATFEMLLEPATAAPPLPPPAGMGWSDLDARSVEAYDAAVRDAFAGSPGLRIPPPAVLIAAALRHRPPARLLRQGEVVAGFVRLGLEGEGTGRIELLGRRRHYRGQGLGRCLLAEGVERLCRAGARRIGLEVVAGNAQALGLYRSAGFAVVEETRVLARRLPGAGRR
ncbi:MAG: GNAT family N-acetyltransferase [Dongiaceae bacterium]